MATVTTEQELRAAISASDPQIIVQNDITLTSQTTINYDLEMISDGSVLSWEGEENKIMFFITGGAVFTIGDIILDGLGKYALLVDVAASTFIMNEGAVLRNVRTNSANRAVRVGLATDVDLGGIFIMNGGLITGVMLDAVVSCTGGTMIMNGEAAIADNLAYGIVLQRGTLNMTGNSRISGNIAARPGAGILAFDNSVINMGLSDGDAPLISDNQSTDGYGGGAYLSDGAVLNMNYRAAVTGNRAVLLSGGIALKAAALNMTGNSVISANTTQSVGGGGIFATSASEIIMSDQSAVRNNEVVDNGGMGGGIYLQEDGTTLILSDAATISDNRASYGGGIYIAEGSLADLSGQTSLVDNMAGTAGAGIYNTGTLLLAGDVTILDGLYYNSEAFVPVIIAPLTEAASIRLEASDYIAPENMPMVAAVKGEEYASLCEADSTAFIVPGNCPPHTPVYRNRELNQVLIGFVLVINRASLSLVKMSALVP